MILSAVDGQIIVYFSKDFSAAQEGLLGLMDLEDEGKKEFHFDVCWTVRHCDNLRIKKELVSISPTYALIYIIKILSQAVTLIAHFTPTCFDPYGSSSGSTAGPC